MRLVGCAYFKQHMRAFQHRTPEALFNSFSQSSSSNLSQQRSQHVQWLDEIRKKIWPRATSQANELPSIDALCLHWRWCVCIGEGSSFGVGGGTSAAEGGQSRVSGPCRGVWGHAPPPRKILRIWCSEASSESISSLTWAVQLYTTNFWLTHWLAQLR